MDITQDPNASAEFFTQKAREWFVVNNAPEFTTGPEAVGMITAGDGLVETYLKQLAAENIPLPDELILQLGSAIGEAYNLVFTGEWRFSPRQGRWVVVFAFPDGSISEVNIFHKLRKRFEYGEEESLQYHFDMIKKIYLEQAETMDRASQS